MDRKSDQSMDCTKFQIVDGKLVKMCECVNKKYGCQWCGLLFYYNTDHQNRCNYQQVKCYCGETMLKALLIEHLLTKCKFIEVDYREPQEYSTDCTTCPRSHFGCKWFGTYKRFNEVHSNQCDYQDIECYCKQNVQKRYLVKHLRGDCAYRLSMPAEQAKEKQSWKKNNSLRSLAAHQNVAEFGGQDKRISTLENQKPIVLPSKFKTDNCCTTSILMYKQL